MAKGINDSIECPVDIAKIEKTRIRTRTKLRIEYVTHKKDNTYYTHYLAGYF